MAEERCSPDVFVPITPTAANRAELYWPFRDGATCCARKHAPSWAGRSASCLRLVDFRPAVRPLVHTACSSHQLSLSFTRADIFAAPVVDGTPARRQRPGYGDSPRATLRLRRIPPLPVLISRAPFRRRQFLSLRLFCSSFAPPHPLISPRIIIHGSCNNDGDFS